GPMFALWLWQSTNATVLYPALLYAIARIANGKRNSVIALTALGIAFLLSGYPAAIVFGIWLGVFYCAVQFIRARRISGREIVRAVVAVALALMIVAPVLDPFVSFLKRSGYLEWRETMSTVSLPPEHLIGLLDAEYLGNPAEGLWRGDPGMGPLNNQVELTFWIGPLAAFLVVLGLFDRRARWRSLAWAGFVAAIVAIMIGAIKTGWILDLPGLRYSPTTRLRLLLPPALAFLVAAGARRIATLPRLGGVTRGPLILLVLGGVLSVQYARVAASFYPYLPLEETRVESKRSLERLAAETMPFRVAPTFLWMMPNSAQMFGVEDIRSQWSSESAYREMIRRIDPQALSHGTVLLLNGLSMNVDDPFLKLLNVRYVIEPPAIDILRWKIEEKLEPMPAPDGEILLGSGESASAYLRVSGEPVSIELVARPENRESEPGSVDFELIRPETGRAIRTVSRSLAQLGIRSKVHVPVGGVASGEVVEVRITPRGGGIVLPSLDGSPFARFSMSSLGVAWENENARVYELLDTLPRYRAVWEIVERSPNTLLEEAGFDFETKAAVEAPDGDLRRRLAAVLPSERRARFRILRYAPSDQTIETSSTVPFLFVASEKLTPELSVFVDGKEIEPMRVNGLFVGFPVEPGTHTIVFERRIGGLWWLVSIVGFVLLGIAGVLER
ncbi:MAG: hypothetical protein R3338_09375, partial [Thermoanaerobaculia bacterium]|nr:hypothetical protein [Thermoanaerobaculia bacterium]